MIRKKIIKKGLCALSVAALLVTSIQLPARAETINLNMTDINEEQDVFSKTYLYDGEYKTVYIYNSDGSAKMTGDIIISTGFGKSECRHIDGYINIPFMVKDFDIMEMVSRNPFSDLTVEYEMVFISTNNKAYTFNKPVLSETYPEDRYMSEQVFAEIGQGESIDGNYVKYQNSFWSMSGDIYGSGIVSSSSVKNIWMLDYASQTLLVEGLDGTYNGVEVFTRISENSLKMKPVAIENASFVKEETVTNLSSVTPATNGTVSTYSFTDLTVAYDSSDRSMTITTTSGRVDFDATNSKFVTDFGDILVTSKEDNEIIHPFVEVLTDADEITESEYTHTTPGHYNSTPVWYWDTTFSSDNGLTLAHDGSAIGYTIADSSDSTIKASVYIDFATNNVSVYAGGTVRNYGVLIQTNGGVKTLDMTNVLTLPNIPSAIAQYTKPFVVMYDESRQDNKIITSFDAQYRVQFEGSSEKEGYKGALYDFTTRENVFVSAKCSFINITGFTETSPALSYTSFFNSILMEDIAYTYDCKDATYVLKNSKELYKVLPTKLNAGSIYLDTIKVADNVVKCAEEYYLTSDGKMYSFDGTLVKSGVTNITDGTYTINDTVYKLDGTEFLKNYATDYNVDITVTDKSVYEVTYGEDIVSVVAPDGTHLSSGDTYICLLNGAYHFEVTNTYGDTFTKTLLVNGLEAGLELPAINVLNNVVTLYSDHTIQISEDLINWSDYTGPIEYEDAFYYRVVTTEKTSDIIKMEIVNGKAQTSNISQAYLQANNFCGYGYIGNDGNLYRLDDYLLGTDVLSAAVYSFGNNGQTTFSTSGIGHDSELYESKKALEENGIKEIYSIFMDDMYTYIIGAQGDVVRAYCTEQIPGASNLVYAVDWNYEWLGNNFKGVSPMGILTYGDGQTINVAYSDTVGVPFTDLKLYTREDIDYYAVGTDLTNVPESGDKIVSVRVVYDGYAALADNGRVYLYDSTIGAMVFDGTILYGNAIQTDIAQSTSSWTNTAVNLVLGESINSDTYDTLSLYSKLINNPTMKGKDILPYMTDWYVLELNITEPTTISFGSDSEAYWGDEKYGNLHILDTGSSCVEAGEIYDENNQLIEYAPLKGYATYHYNLGVGTYYVEFWDDSLEFSSTYTINGETFYFAELFESEMLTNVASPYVVKDANGNTIPTNVGENGYYATVTNGKYTIHTVVDGKIQASNTVVVNNVDTVKPSITPTIAGNTLKFSASDLSGGNSAVSGIDKIFYSTDNVTFVEIEEGAQIKYSLARALEPNTVNVSSQYVYMYTVDKAGNRSDTYTFDLSVASIEIKTGKPTIDFDGNNKATIKANTTELENATFKYLWVSVDGAEYVRYDSLAAVLELEEGTHTIKSYQTVVATADADFVLDSEITEKTVTVEGNADVDEPTDEPVDEPTDEPVDTPTDKPVDPNTGNAIGCAIALAISSLLIAICLSVRKREERAE